MGEMASRRTRLLDELAALVEPALWVIDPGTGWPALVEIRTGGGATRASLHLGRVGLSHRDRDDVERRYQNPASCDPVRATPGTVPLILGLWKQPVPILVAHDAQKRLGQGGTRTSLFVGLAALRAAVKSGWAEYVNDEGERIVAFWPQLLPMYVEMASGGVLIAAEQALQVIRSADVQPMEPASTERARRAVSALVRDTRFRAIVVEAYSGVCAMCGIGLGIVEGAHIYPASAPGSADTVANGLALCPNHHALFDRRLIWIEPVSRRIRVHPVVLAQAQSAASSRLFVTTTLAALLDPRDPGSRVSDAMISARNAYYADAYAWCAH